MSRGRHDHIRIGLKLCSAIRNRLNLGAAVYPYLFAPAVLRLLHHASAQRLRSLTGDSQTTQPAAADRPLHRDLQQQSDTHDGACTTALTGKARHERSLTRLSITCQTCISLTNNP